VVTGNGSTCGGITGTTTLAGVISAATLTWDDTFVVTDDCDNINFTAVRNGQAVDLVATSTGPSSWAVTGATNNSGWGSVSCVTPVNNNGTATCTGSVSGGYQLNSAAGSSTLCGTVSVSGTSITAGPVTGACTVTGTFGAVSPSNWTVTGATNNGAWGTVNCTSPVTNGNYASCTATPAPNYRLASASGCGTTTVSGNTIAAGPVTAACSVTGTFAAIPVATQSSIPTATSGVTATLSAVGCSSVDTNATRFIAATGAPANTAFPFGLLDFTLNGCASSVTITVTYSAPLPSGTATFYKQINGVYSPFTATIDRNTNSVTFTLRDEQAGEDEAIGQAGVIRDPSGLGFAASAESIPTLSEWGTLILSTLLGLFTLGAIRRRKTNI
jgi:hypothetical protein